MKSKKFLLVLAVISSILTVGFCFGTIIFYTSPPDTREFTKNITYNEGIVEDVIEDPKERAHTVSLKDCNTSLSVDCDAIDSELTTFDLQTGDTIVFGLSESSQQIFDEGGYVVSVVYLATPNSQIVSVETYEQSIVDNMNIARQFFVVGMILFLCISLVCYTLYFKSKIAMKRNVTE